MRRRRRRFQSGGHMHNVNQHQHDVTVPSGQMHGQHFHHIERPMADQGDFWGTPNAAYHMLRHRHDTHSTIDGQTGVSIWEPYGDPDHLGPGQGVYPTRIGPTDMWGNPQAWSTPELSAQTSTTAGQTTGEVGSVPGAGHVHRTGPSVRARRGGRVRNRRRGGRLHKGGFMHNVKHAIGIGHRRGSLTGSPNSCVDGYGNNVPC